MVNAEDPACEPMVADCKARLLRYGIVGDGLPADALDIAARCANSRLRVCGLICSWVRGQKAG